MAPDPDDYDRAFNFLAVFNEKAHALKRIAAILEHTDEPASGLEVIGAAAKLRQIADELDHEGPQLAHLTIDRGVKVEIDDRF